jgi:replicative DNA helicase
MNGALAPDGDARLRPHDLGAEAAVLSAVMVDPSALDKVRDFLRPEHFYSEAHRRIFDACIKLSARGNPVDVVQVATWLRDRDRLRQVDGVAYLTEVLNAAPAVANVRAYAQTIHDKWRARQLLLACQRVTAQCYAGHGDAQRLIDSALNDLAALERGPTARQATTFGAVFKRWKEEGPLIHEPTGLATLDAATGGGPVYGSRWYLLGAPDACKTLMLVQIADAWLRRGVVVGFLAVDEEDVDLVTRFVQRAVPLDLSRQRFTRRDCEDRIASVVDEMEQALAALPIRFYGPEWTVEAAAEDLADYAKSLSTPEQPRRAALFVDSIQQVRCRALSIEQSREPSPREVVNANVRALRAVATTHRLIAIATGEMNRAAYADIDLAETRSDLAAAKESGAIEYSARVMLSFRWIREHEGELVRVRVVKNKHGPSYPRQEDITLRLDRERQALQEAQPPPTPDATEQRDAKGAKQVTADAAKVVAVLSEKHPHGVGVNEARNALKARHGSFSKDRLGPAVSKLGASVARRCAGPGERAPMYLDGSAVPPDVLALLTPEVRQRVVACRPPAEAAE